MKRILFFILMLAAISACKKTEFAPVGPTDVRIHNLSDQTLGNLTVKIRGRIQNYGNVGAGLVSDYMRFDTAYVKAEISAIINSVTFTTGTVEYRGLTYQGQVRLTYKIWISDFPAKKLEISGTILEEPLVLK